MADKLQVLFASYRDQYGLATFCGTGAGDVARLASEMFSTAYVHEQDNDLRKAAMSACAHRNNVVFGVKSSVDFLNQFKALLRTERVLYWLNAHRYTGPEQYRGCPVIAELEMLNNVFSMHTVVLIGKADAFLSNAPYGGQLPGWCAITDIDVAVSAWKYPRGVVNIVGDVIAITPRLPKRRRSVLRDGFPTGDE